MFKDFQTFCPHLENFQNIFKDLWHIYGFWRNYLKTIPGKIMKQFKNGGQWQHKVSLEVVWLLETTSHQFEKDYQTLDILFLTQEGCRKQLSHKDFLEKYKSIPTMNGAYK